MMHRKKVATFARRFLVLVGLVLWGVVVLFSFLAGKQHQDRIPDWLAYPTVFGFMVFLLWKFRSSFIWKDFQRYGALLTGRIARRQAAAREDSRPPFLFLRSFFDSNLLRYEYSNLLHIETVSVDLVSNLSKAVSRHGPLLAIGGAELEVELSRHRKIAFIDSSDSNWEAIFSTIAISSRAILLAPGITQGVFREVAAILELELLERTLVFMPPAPVRPLDAMLTADAMRPITVLLTPTAVETRVEAADALSSQWSRVQSAWKKKGLNLPDYSFDGMLFIPKRDFSARYMYPIGKLSNLENVIDKMLPYLRGPVRSAIDILDECSSLQK